MMQRILTLTVYLIYRSLTSLSGLWFLLAGAVYYWLAFRVRTPEAAYFTLVIGLFGAGLTFLAVLSMAGKANEAISYPYFPRLESRIEFLTAVLAAGFGLALLLQLLLAAVVLIRNAPEFTLGQALEIPPIWLSANLILAVLAMHASDFVANTWSRVKLFGVLAVLILLAENFNDLVTWLAERLRTLSYTPSLNSTQQSFASSLRAAADFLANSQSAWLEETAGLIFWPFRAVISGVTNGTFSRLEALAPALLILAATVLFLLAADIFAGKDLVLVEE